LRESHERVAEHAMSAMTTDRDLLDRLAAEVLAGEPDPSDCDLLAERLVAVGATAAAARWRTWGMLPAATDQLLEAIGEASLQLLEGGGSLRARSPMSETWRSLQQRLDEGAPPAELEGWVQRLKDDPTPGKEALMELSQRLLAAEAPRAALAALDPLMREAVVDALLANRLAQVQRACGNTHQGELWSRLSLKAQPDQPLVWFQLARLLLDQGVLDEGLECAEAGLGYAPSHPWALKLRANALATSRGWHTYERLRERGGLPADADFVASLDAERSRFQRRSTLGRRRPEPLALDARLRLRSLLKPVKEPIGLLWARSGEALRWLLEAGAWSTPPEVIPHASRDPFRVAEELTAAGFTVRAERPLRRLNDLERIDLTVIERPPGHRLPLLLGSQLRGPGLVLAPVGLVRLSERCLGRCGGWELFAGTTTDIQAAKAAGTAQADL
jgi:tetratricopeptide (TPR) repeat protein